MSVFALPDAVAACWAQNLRAGSAGKPAYVPGVPISLVMPDFEAAVTPSQRLT